VNNYNKDYYIINRPDNDALPSLGADKNTATLHYSTTPKKSNSPLVFSNNLSENNRDYGISEEIGPVLFNNNDIIINDNIYTELVGSGIDRVDFSPSIYIDDGGMWHENYWFMVVSDSIDCWSRSKSKYSNTEIKSTGARYIYSFYLDADILDKIPLQERLIFKIDKSALGLIFIHKTIADKLSLLCEGSCDLILVAEYEG
jgi:hypothetical protein